MAFKKIYEIIVDIETVGIFSPQKSRGENGMLISNAVFNVGITVQDSKGNVVLSEQYGVQDIWEFPEHRILDFYRKNFKVEDFEIMYDDFESFYKQKFLPLLKQYNGKAKIRLWSYNAEFDRRGFVDNLKMYNLRLPDSIFENWSCIMILAMSVLDNNPRLKSRYYQFLIENEFKSRDYKFITRKGNFKTSAEAFYRWIKNDPTFIEAHKGKEDSKIEGEILQWIKKQKGWSNLNRKPQGGGWAICNNTAKPFQGVSTIIADYDLWDTYPDYVQIKHVEAFDFLLERARKASVV